MFEKMNTMKRMLQCVNSFKNVIIFFFNKWIIYVIIFAELSNELLIIWVNWVIYMCKFLFLEEYRNK